MRYPCAYEGVGKIRKAMAINIALIVINILSNLIGIIASGTLDQWEHLGEEIPAAAIVIAILAVPMAILGLVSMVIEIIGVRKAAQEEPEFDTAFWIILADIILSVINGFIADDCREPKLYLTIASSILGLLATIFIIKGIKTLAGFLEKSEVICEAPRVRNVLIVVYAVGIVVLIVSNMLYDHNNYYLLAGIAGLIGSALEFAAYFYYLKFLKKAEDMLGYDLYMTSDEAQ